MKRSAPLLAERLPLYATDAELRAVIFGARAADPACVATYRRMSNERDFPRLSPALGGRHVPSVLAWFDKFEAGLAVTAEPTDNERAQRWNKSKRLA